MNEAAHAVFSVRPTNVTLWRFNPQQGLHRNVPVHAFEVIRDGERHMFHVGSQAVAEGLATMLNQLPEQIAMEFVDAMNRAVQPPLVLLGHMAKRREEQVTG